MGVSRWDRGLGRLEARNRGADPPSSTEDGATEAGQQRCWGYVGPGRGKTMAPQRLKALLVADFTARLKPRPDEDRGPAEMLALRWAWQSEEYGPSAAK